MPDRWKLVSVAVVVLAALGAPGMAGAGTPDLTQSFYVPQAGDPDPTGALAGSITPMSPAVLTEGTVAVRLFRACPNNEGGTSLPNNARIKVVVRDANGNGIPNVPAADICVLLNGGTVAQGFSGIGADSVIANSQWNPSHPFAPPDPLTSACPDVRCLQADGPTNAAGVTFITFTGSNPASRGIGIPDPNRNWGHYDAELPVYVMGFKISGRITTGSANGTYVLRIKNYDWTGGLGTLTNQGEWVTVTDFNGIVNGIGVNNIISYWKDFDSVTGVAVNDLNLATNHLNHNCSVPFSPGP
jgi:hypothetical protein